MAKMKKTTAFFCQECGYESAKWTGQCPACKAWNSMVEEPVRAKSAAGIPGVGAVSRGELPVPLSLSEIPRESTR